MRTRVRRRRVVRGAAAAMLVVGVAGATLAAIAAVGVSMLLNTIQQPSYAVFTTSGARVGDPGHNLVGPG